MSGKKRKKDVGVEDVVEQGQRLVKTSIELGFDVWKKAKIRALETGLSLAEITETALRKFLEKEKGKE